MSAPLYTPAQVREADERTIAGGVASLVLMERAAGHLARAVLAVAGRSYGLRVAVLCGKGNNGGDGLAAACRLTAAGAYPVVHVSGDVGVLAPDARVQWQRWTGRSGRVAATAEQALAGADVAVDCLLGTGARGEPRDPERQVIAGLDGFGGPVVACDLPSGVDALTGAVPGVAVRADVTVTLGAHKVGLWLWPARGYAGRIVLGDIGILGNALAPLARLVTATDVAKGLGHLGPEVHKRSRGTVLVVAGTPGSDSSSVSGSRPTSDSSSVSGSRPTSDSSSVSGSRPRMSGAAVLTARGAMAAGAGLVTAASIGAARDVVAAAVPEALTVALPADDPEAAFEVVAAHARRAAALAVGPGLGAEPSTVALVRRIVAQIDRPLVLDADGLNAFREDPGALAGHASKLLVLTPHAGEYARLAGGEVATVWPRRLETVPQHAAAWRAVVVAKGPGTLVAAPDGQTWVNPTGSAALATGGTGDVLAGMLAALVAQRPEPESVALGVWVHGAAGEEAARRTHERSVTALDVAGAVPAALRRCEDST